MRREQLRHWIAVLREAMDCGEITFPSALDEVSEVSEKQVRFLLLRSRIQRNCERVQKEQAT